MAYYGYGWRPYVPVAQRRARALRELKKLQKQGKKIDPVEIEGRKIARTFWGQAWCGHLEQFSDYANRLPRGRTYVRNGSVCHLAISKGRIEAVVSGSELYNIDIRIKSLPSTKWKKLRRQCAGQIGSMLELLQGHFSDQVMAVVTNRDHGLFPNPKEIALACDCPDWALMCKHLAAVLYGVGARLDQHPEHLFVLRGIDHEELISTELDVRAATTGTPKRRRLPAGDLAGVFGIEIDDAVTPTRKKRARKKKTEAKTKNQSTARENQRATSKTTRTVKKKTAKGKPFAPTPTRIVRLRKRFALNRAQFARLLGVSPATVARWENGSGRLNLRPDTLAALSRASWLIPAHAQAKAGKKLRGL